MGFGGEVDVAFDEQEVGRDGHGREQRLEDESNAGSPHSLEAQIGVELLVLSFVEFTGKERHLEAYDISVDQNLEDQEDRGYDNDVEVHSTLVCECTAAITRRSRCKRVLRIDECEACVATGLCVLSALLAERGGLLERSGDRGRLGLTETVLDVGQLRVEEYIEIHLLHLEKQEQDVLVSMRCYVEAHVGLASLHHD